MGQLLHRGSDRCMVSLGFGFQLPHASGAATTLPLAPALDQALLVFQFVDLPLDSLQFRLEGEQPLGVHTLLRKMLCELRVDFL
ncbi:hypothetical protein D3C71_1500350 [compost metagenome]